MATLTKEEIIERIKSMSVLQLMDLVKFLEQYHGVSAEASTVVPAAGTPACDDEFAAVEEKAEIEGDRSGVEHERENMINAILEVLGCGPEEAKSFSDANKAMGIGKKEFEEIKQELREACASA